jgi:hypothetical protein
MPTLFLITAVIQSTNTNEAVLAIIQAFVLRNLCSTIIGVSRELVNKVDIMRECFHPSVNNYSI